MSKMRIQSSSKDSQEKFDSTPTVVTKMVGASLGPADGAAVGEIVGNSEGAFDGLLEG